jgi:hypothetical protein
MKPMIPIPKNPPPVHASVAREQGYIPLAGPYNPSTEGWMLNNALADLRRGRRDFAMVIEFAHLPDELSIYIRNFGGGAAVEREEEAA